MAGVLVSCQYFLRLLLKIAVAEASATSEATASTELSATTEAAATTESTAATTTADNVMKRQSDLIWCRWHNALIHISVSAALITEKIIFHQLLPDDFKSVSFSSNVQREGYTLVGFFNRLFFARN